jgi:penicillin-binding protein 2
VAVAAKTGTASVPSGSANGIFVAFAPADNPEIAVSVVVHHGGHGNSIAPIAKAVLDEYFSVEQVEDNIVKENVLLP